MIQLYEESNLTIDRQTRSIETLNNQLAELKTKCANTENQYRDSLNEKSGMLRSSQSNQNKLVELGNQIEEKRNQKLRLSDLVNTLSKDISLRTQELQEATTQLEGIETEIEKSTVEFQNYRKILDDRNSIYSKLQRTPLRDAIIEQRVSVGFQIDRLEKSIASTKSGLIDTSLLNTVDFNQVKVICWLFNSILKLKVVQLF